MSLIFTRPEFCLLGLTVLSEQSCQDLTELTELYVVIASYFQTDIVGIKKDSSLSLLSLVTDLYQKEAFSLNAPVLFPKSILPTACVLGVSRTTANFMSIDPSWVPLALESQLSSLAFFPLKRHRRHSSEDFSIIIFFRLFRLYLWQLFIIYDNSYVSVAITPFQKNQI